MSSKLSSEKNRSVLRLLTGEAGPTQIHTEVLPDTPELAGKSVRYWLQYSIDGGNLITLIDQTINFPDIPGGGGGGVTPVTPGGGGTTTLPTDGRAQEKGASKDPTTWKVIAMKDDPNLFKIVDASNVNVADQFHSLATAQQYVRYYVENPTGGGGGGGVTPIDTGGGGGTIAGMRIYKPKAGGRIKTDAKESGGQGASDGIRYNIANDHDLVNRETTFWGTISKIDTGGDKLHVSPKIGSHGSQGEGSALLEASIDYKGGKARIRTEGPHPSYHSCSGGTVATLPAIPMGREIAFKVAQYKTGTGSDSKVEFYYDFAPDAAAGKFNWIKYAELLDSGKPCEISLLDSSGNIVGPAKAQDTMRMNSAFTPAPWKGEIVEIDVVDGKPVPMDGTSSSRRASKKSALVKFTASAADSKEQCDEKT